MTPEQIRLHIQSNHDFADSALVHADDALVAEMHFEAHDMLGIDARHQHRGRLLDLTDDALGTDERRADFWGRVLAVRLSEAAGRLGDAHSGTPRFALTVDRVDRVRVTGVWDAAGAVHDPDRIPALSGYLADDRGVFAGRYARAAGEGTREHRPVLAVGRHRPGSMAHADGALVAAHGLEDNVRHVTSRRPDDTATLPAGPQGVHPPYRTGHVQPLTTSDRVSRLLRAEAAGDLADMVRDATGIDPVRLDVEVYEPTGEPGAFGIHRIWDAAGTEYGRDDLDQLLELDETSLPSIRAFCARFGRGDYDLTVDRSAVPTTSADEDGDEPTTQLEFGDPPDSHSEGPSRTADVAGNTGGPLTAAASSDAERQADQVLSLTRRPQGSRPTMATLADDATRRQRLRNAVQISQLRTHDVETTVRRHARTILFLTRTSIGELDQRDVDWDGVETMFEMVDGHIPHAYVNVSAAIDDDEDRDEVDTDVERALNADPAFRRDLDRLADDWGRDLASESVWIGRTIDATADAPDNDAAGQLLDDPTLLKASHRRRLAADVADVLGISRRAAYTLVDDGLPAARLGNHASQVAEIVGRLGR